MNSAHSKSVLLINPPLVKSSTNVWRHIDSCTPPFGLAILAAILLEQGISVKILDCNALGIPLDMMERSLPTGTYDIVGITASTALFHNAQQVAAICRKQYPAATIIMGGVHPTVRPDECLECPSIDLVVRGEGERSFLKLARGAEPASVSGVSYRSDGTVIHTDADMRPVDIDENPLPAYQLLPMNRYHTALGSSRRLPGIGLVVSRGCPGRCTYCYGHFLGRKVRFRDPRIIFNEIQLLMSNYGIREVAFYDDTFTTYRKKVRSLCRLLIDSRTDLSWSCFSRVDTVDLDTLRIMRAAGCHQISVGVESGSEMILDNINKDIDLSRTVRMVSECRKVGIMVRACFMLGNPGETPETIRQTIDFAKQLNPDIVLFNITTPYPGTRMFDWADSNGYLTTYDWRDYDLSKVVMELPSVNKEHLECAYKRAYREFYLRPAYLWKRLLKIRSLADIKMNWNGLQAVFKTGRKS